MGRYKDIVEPEPLSEIELIEVFDKTSRVEHRGLDGKAWLTLFKIAWVFGKRVGEIVRMRVSDIVITDTHMFATFYVEKKRGKKNRFTKKITLENKHTAPIVEYVKNKEREKAEYLFPLAHNGKRPYIYEEYVWQVCQMVMPTGRKGLGEDSNKHLFPHLFRHTLATTLARNDATTWELKDWFDWASTAMADEYVHGAGSNTPKITDRKF